MKNKGKDLLKLACERCEQYGGTGHNYEECEPQCPVYEMYKLLIKTQMNLETTREELSYAKEEKRDREQRDRGYWGIFG